MDEFNLSFLHHHISFLSLVFAAVAINAASQFTTPFAAATSDQNLRKASSLNINKVDNFAFSRVLPDAIVYLSYGTGDNVVQGQTIHLSGQVRQTLFEIHP